MILSKKRITKVLIRLRDVQAGLRLCCSLTPTDMFSCEEAHLNLICSVIDAD